jgi:hypothetical protein
MYPIIKGLGYYFTAVIAKHHKMLDALTYAIDNAPGTRAQVKNVKSYAHMIEDNYHENNFGVYTDNLASNQHDFNILLSM